MRLNDLQPSKGARHRRKRVGCGEGSGHGKTSGRGHKGQKSRSGASIRPGFLGGTMPLARQLPKRGFNNAQFETVYAVVNVGLLEERFEDGAVISESSLREAGIVSGRWDGVKILGDGEVKKKFTLEVDKISASARKKIEGAGGSCKEKEAKSAPAVKAGKKAPAAKKEKEAVAESTAVPAESEVAAEAPVETENAAQEPAEDDKASE